MSYPIKYPTPQGANVQIFSEPNATASWVKPQGASFVWFTLIGAGGGGGGSDALGPAVGGGGGSGAVTNCLVPAFLIPDVLRVFVGLGGARGPAGGQGAAGTASTIVYQQKDGTGYTLLTANGGTQGQVGAGGTGGAATASGPFSAAGFYSSVAGVGAGTSNTLVPSATTFLTNGTDLSTVGTTNYGYTNGTGGTTKRNGFFQLQPIIVGVGGCSDSSTNEGDRGGVGCGGGGASAVSNSAGGRGGDGLVVIISW